MASKMNKKDLYEAYKKQQKEIGLLSLEVSNLENIREENCSKILLLEDENKELKKENETYYERWHQWMDKCLENKQEFINIISEFKEN